MDRSAFEAALTRDGFTILANTMPPHTARPEHVHPFDARLMVLEGEMTITREGAPTRTYAAGETFEMPVGCRHAETAGADGVSYVVGRRTPQNRSKS